MANDLETYTEDNGREIDIINPVTVFDIERFDQVMRVASVMAAAPIIPDHLRVKDADGFDYEATKGNCFLIANLAANWGMDPFQVAQASAVVFGKVMLEGKLIRSIIRKFLGFDLSYAFFGNEGDMERRVYVSEKPLIKIVDGEEVAMTEAEIVHLMENSSARITTGTLRKWHTKNKTGGINDNWAKDERKMFRERGSREWCREFAPGLMLGIYSPDEFDELDTASRSNRSRDITPASNPLLDDRRRTAMEKVNRETGEVVETNQQSSTAQGSSARATRDPDAGEGGDQSGARVEAATFRSFNTTLLRYASVDSLAKANTGFWKENGGLPRDKDQYDLGAKIYDAHKQRINGALTPDEAKSVGEKAIDDAFKL